MKIWPVLVLATVALFHLCESAEIQDSYIAGMRQHYPKCYKYSIYRKEAKKHRLNEQYLQEYEHYMDWIKDQKKNHYGDFDDEERDDDDDDDNKREHRGSDKDDDKKQEHRGSDKDDDDDDKKQEHRGSDKDDDDKKQEHRGSDKDDDDKKPEHYKREEKDEIKETEHEERGEECQNFERPDGSYRRFRFRCPLPFHKKEHKICCGRQNAGFCCHPKDKEHYSRYNDEDDDDDDDEHGWNMHKMRIVGLVVGLLLIIGVIVIIVVSVCVCKKKQRRNAKNIAPVMVEPEQIRVEQSKAAEVAKAKEAEGVNMAFQFDAKDLPNYDQLNQQQQQGDRVATPVLPQYLTPQSSVVNVRSENGEE